MIKKLLATLGVIILFTSAAFAQSQIKGKVTDQEKTPLPYTRVFLKTGDRVVNMATADGNGDYTLFNIEAGTYDLEVDAVMQNKKMTKSGVTVATNEVVFIDFEIDLTNDVEEVIIEWEPPHKKVLLLWTAMWRLFVVTVPMASRPLSTVCVCAVVVFPCPPSRRSS